MPKGIYTRKKKKVVKPKPVIKGRHFDRIVMDDVVSTQVHPTNLYGQAMGVDYRKMYEDLKKDEIFKRYQYINDWIKSIATINDAIAHAIGEIGGGRF